MDGVGTQDDVEGRRENENSKHYDDDNDEDGKVVEERMTNKYLRAVWQIICFARSKIFVKICKLTCFSLTHAWTCDEPWRCLGKFCPYLNFSGHIRLTKTQFRHIIVGKHFICDWTHIWRSFWCYFFLSLYQTNLPCPSSNLQHKQKHHLLWSFYMLCTIHTQFYFYYY